MYKQIKSLAWAFLLSPCAITFAAVGSGLSFDTTAMTITNSVTGPYMFLGSVLLFAGSVYANHHQGDLSGLGKNFATGGMYAGALMAVPPTIRLLVPGAAGAIV